MPGQPDSITADPNDKRLNDPFLNVGMSEDGAYIAVQEIRATAGRDLPLHPQPPVLPPQTHQLLSLNGSGRPARCPGQASRASPSAAPNPPRSRIPGPPAPAAPPASGTPWDTASHRLACRSFAASLPPALSGEKQLPIKLSQLSTKTRPPHSPCASRSWPSSPRRTPSVPGASRACATRPTWRAGGCSRSTRPTA